jgi:PIN domain nuclease of toxin-antitoxin system
MPDSSGPLLLDTHVWIWAVEGNRQALSQNAIWAIEDASKEGRILVSAISIWEVAMLEARGRITLSRSVEAWVEAALRGPGVRLLELSPAISVESTRLPGDPPADPADRILLASARNQDASLLTCDRRLLDYADAGHVRAVNGRE